MTDRLDRVVAEWARRTPGAPAVLWDDTGVGYAELVARAADAAETLRHNGIHPGSVVPVAVAPSVELVAAVLGCLRAGGIAVVLDPAWPAWCTEDVFDRAVALSTPGTAYLACVPGLRPRPVAFSHKETLAALTGPPLPDGADFWSEVWAALLGGGCAMFDTTHPAEPEQETDDEAWPTYRLPVERPHEPATVLVDARRGPDDDFLRCGR